ncbi:hypothetical protein [Parvibaculum sp.]|uniref:hypothetical protein n=1 Tax=Parvibaculum sp. TaxID=2024848 RepID=UPI00320CA27F
MRTVKIAFAFLLFLAGVAITGLTYIQSHIAGIATGMLLVIVNAAYAFDHRHALFGMELSDRPARPATQTVALRHGQIIATRQDGSS